VVKSTHRRTAIFLDAQAALSLPFLPIARGDEAEVAIPGKDDVVEEADAEKVATFAKPFGDLDVFRTRFYGPARMIVADENRLSIASHGALEGFARVHN
jgi:hypothetical protein